MRRSVASLFWDYPGRRPSLARDRDLVVRRILTEPWSWPSIKAAVRSWVQEAARR